MISIPCGINIFDKEFDAEFIVEACHEKNERLKLSRHVQLNIEGNIVHLPVSDAMVRALERAVEYEISLEDQMGGFAPPP